MNLGKSPNATTAHPAWVWVALLASLPVLTALVSFRTDGQFAIWQIYARQFWLPTQVFEIATIIFAFSQGGSIWRSISVANAPVRLLSGIWFASMTLAAALSEAPNLAVLSLVSWTVHALFLLTIIFLARRWLIDGRWQVLVATYIPVGSAAFSLLLLLFVMMVGLDTDFDWVSWLPGFPNIRHSGYFLMPAMALSAGMIAVGGRKARRIHPALLAINLGFTCWIGSRGPLVIFVVTLLLAILLFADMRRSRALGSIVLATTAGCLLSQMVPSPQHPAFNAIMRIEGEQAHSVDQMSSGRTVIWRDTLSRITERPFVGHGGNQFRLQVPAARNTYNHPHNSVLQFLYEWGVIGTGAMLALLGLLGWRFLIAEKGLPVLWLPHSLAALSMVMFSFIDGVFYYNLPIILFLTLGLGTIAQATKPNMPSRASKGKAPISRIIQEAVHP